MLEVTRTVSGEGRNKWKKKKWSRFTTRARDYQPLSRSAFLSGLPCLQACLKPFSIHPHCYTIDPFPFVVNIPCSFHPKSCDRRLVDCPHHVGRHDMLERPLLHVLVAHVTRGPLPIPHWSGARSLLGKDYAENRFTQVTFVRIPIPFCLRHLALHPTPSFFTLDFCQQPHRTLITLVTRC
jgi:hypothetical protein